MMFWVKHLSVAFFLIIIGIYLVFFFDASSLESESTALKPEIKQNKAVQNFNRFYSELKSKLSPFEEERSTFVIDISDGDNRPLEEALSELTTTKYAVNRYWTGKKRVNRFAKGSTLKTVLNEIAIAENMNLIWALDRDFVVKGDFREDQTALGTLYKIVIAIDSDFELDVYGYLCPRQRSLVIVDKMTNYLRRNCVQANREHLIYH